ncbi:MAG: 2-oxo acid dehydrogenase subunit E2 [Chloroflexi bacterium]|nr:2-oxo acid dehydrogenase subunit E2 [Chloroflexota bacterium]
MGKWLKNVGDHVDKYEPIVEVITDKVNAEVPSPFAGTLSEILVQEGETVPNDTEIAVIEAAGEGAEAEPAAASPGGAASAEAPAAVAGAEAVADEILPGESNAPEPDGGHGPAGSDERSAPASAAPSTATTAPAATATVAPAATVTAPSGSSTAGSNGAGDVAGYTGRMTPAVRRLAREHSVDLAQIAGSGHDGRVTRDDVMKWVESGGASAGTSPTSAGQQASAAAPAAAPAPPRAQSTPAPSTSAAAAPSPTPAPAATGAPSQDELKPMTPMRKAIARHMVESKSTAPHAYTTVEVDMFGVVALRDSVKRQYQEREGTALSFVAIVGKAVVEGLRRNPDLNAHWTEEGVMRRASVNLGVAVAVDDGLIVPVIKDADRYSIHGLNLWVQDYATRARANRLKMDDIQGGTFTLNNTGWFGSVSSQPIVNVPEIAILSMEAIVKRPVVVETPAGDTIGIRPMMNICVSFDHRGTDGAQIGRFVQDVKRWLESVDPQTPVW